MANTWNKIRTKWSKKWKKGGSRSNRNRRRAKRNSSSSRNNINKIVTPNQQNQHNQPISTPKAAQQHNNSITTLPKQKSIKKRTSKSKSNLFGCLTSVPHERENYNVQPQQRNNNKMFEINESQQQIEENNNIHHIQPQQTRNNNKNKNKNNIKKDSPKINKLCQEKPEFIKIEKGSSTYQPPTKYSPATEQMEIGKACHYETIEQHDETIMKFNRINHNEIKSTKSKYQRPISPSKSKTNTSYFTSDLASKYIYENVAPSSICSSESPKHHRDRDRDNNKLLSTPENVIISNTNTRYNNHHQHYDSEIRYQSGTATPTPQTGVSYASSSEICGVTSNHATHEVEDIYDGVIEVENDKIIQEGDMSSYYYDEHDENDESIKHEQDDDDDDDDDMEPIMAIEMNHDDEDDEDDDVDDINNHNQNEQRESVIIKSPRDIVNEFVAVSTDQNTNTSMNETLCGLDGASIEVSHIDENDFNDNTMKINNMYQGIIHEQFIDELNDELRRNGYQNPELLLQTLWNEQMEIERGDQILQILDSFCQKVECFCCLS